MKFTASQIEFLLTKLTLADLEEAKTFVPTARPICSSLKKNGDACKNKSTKDGLCNVHSIVKEVKVKQPISEDEKCSFIKKDGNICAFKKKTGDFCGRHCKKDIVVESSSSSDSE